MIFAATSFAELSHLNIYLWIGLSEEASAILKRLQDEGVFHYKPAPVLVYLCDGRALTLPIAKAVFSVIVQCSFRAGQGAAGVALVVVVVITRA